jgi:pimeloyl-ACP methyl ester carboxylesterase
LRIAFLGLCFLAPLLPAAEQRGTPPGAERMSLWHGFVRGDFTLGGKACTVVVPKTAAPGRPWIWRMEYFDVEPQADLALLERGWHVAYMDVHDMYGGPKAMALFGEFYARLVAQYELAPRMVLEGFDRGGLAALNFAATHPSRVLGIFLASPAVDILSWPGRDRGSKEWKECLEAYNLTEATVAAFRGNPIDRIGLMAGARIPILVVAGDADRTVPFAENTAKLQQRYTAAGGPIQVITKPGADHQPYSLPDPAPIVDFVLRTAQAQ